MHGQAHKRRADRGKQTEASNQMQADRGKQTELLAEERRAEPDKSMSDGESTKIQREQKPRGRGTL